MNSEESNNGQKVVNYIVDGHYTKLRELFEEHPNLINYISHSGLGAIHIAAFKQDYNLIKFLLDMKAVPELFNKDGNSLIHISCLLGDINMLELMIPLCLLLERPNKDLLTPSEICLCVPNIEDQKYFTMFQGWSRDNYLNDERLFLNNLKKGRDMCYRLLTGIIKERNDQQIIICRDTLEQNTAARNRLYRYFRPPKTSIERQFCFREEYPEYPQDGYWSKESLQLFQSDEYSILKVANKVFMTDFANRSVYQASKIVEKKMLSVVD